MLTELMMQMSVWKGRSGFEAAPASQESETVECNSDGARYSRREW